MDKKEEERKIINEKKKKKRKEWHYFPPAARSSCKCNPSTVTTLNDSLDRFTLIQNERIDVFFRVVRFIGIYIRARTNAAWNGRESRGTGRAFGLSGIKTKVK